MATNATGRGYIAEGKRKVQYVVTDEWYDALSDRADAEGRTMTAVVTDAVDAYVAKPQKAVRRARKAT